ncbi:MAG: PLP-dependent aspartate aminotransferase family protein [Anaerolineae bacterium]|jgi:cystathionine gamma-synthase/methionine-gamma-lyase
MAKWETREDSINAEIRRPDPRYLDKGLATQCVHAGERWPEDRVWTSNTPIYRSTTYFYDQAEDLDDRMFNREAGYIYTRGGNPTQSALERALSTLERADATRVCASGMAATHLALVAAGAGPGSPILCSSDVYGSVFTMVQNIFPRLGAPAHLIDFTDLDRLEAAMAAHKPAIVCFEVITNPMTKVIDAPAVIDMAHRHGAVAIVDSTYTTPYLFRPLAHGADYVTHSASKYLSGHGDVLAGSVSCRRQDYDHLLFTAIQLGGTLGPQDCWLVQRGLKTFPLRMARHCDNALAIARFLQAHPLIERVWYTGLPGHPQHETARRLFPEGRYGAMLNFDVAHCDSKEKVFRFLDTLQIILPATSLGDVYSLIVNPARSTHNWLSDEELAAIGIGVGTFRMSVGIEDAEDLKEDLDRALAACQ